MYNTYKELNSTGNVKGKENIIPGSTIQGQPRVTF